jgi:hypothetical protein
LETFVREFEDYACPPGGVPIAESRQELGRSNIYPITGSDPQLVKKLALLDKVVSA